VPQRAAARSNDGETTKTPLEVTAAVAQADGENPVPAQALAAEEERLAAAVQRQVEQSAAVQDEEAAEEKLAARNKQAGDVPAAAEPAVQADWENPVPAEALAAEEERLAAAVQRQVEQSAAVQDKPSTKSPEQRAHEAAIMDNGGNAAMQPSTATKGEDDLALTADLAVTATKLGVTVSGPFWSLRCSLLIELEDQP
jgi:hypothetical protein